MGFWSFVGAGVFGFLINLPIVSYFEGGTLLTSNHGHTAMFGVFGMLALAVLIFCLRAMQTDAVWGAGLIEELRRGTRGPRPAQGRTKIGTVGRAVGPPPRRKPRGGRPPGRTRRRGQPGGCPA